MYGERTPYIHRHVVCVCVCVSEQKGKPSFCTEAALEIEWPYHHKDMVCECVCVYGKRENHPVPQGRGGGGRGGGGSPSSLARGRGKAEHKTAAMGEGMPQKQRDILFHRATPQKGYPVPQMGAAEYITGY